MYGCEAELIKFTKIVPAYEEAKPFFYPLVSPDDVFQCGKAVSLP